jgi:predicted O-linked N-acetylglucosamine transferase (SPINDLY family)
MNVKIKEELALALKHQQEGNLEQAKKIFSEILQVEPNNICALHFLGLLYYRLKRYDLSLSLIKKAIEYEPNYVDAYNNLGVILSDVGQYDEAIECYQQAIRVNTNSFFAHYNLGNILREKGHFDKAITCYSKAIELNPTFAEAHCNLGYSLQQKGNLDHAISCYRKAIELNPNFSEAHCNLATVLQNMGLFDEAVNHYRHAIDLNPNSPVAVNNLGNALAEQGKLNEAASCYRLALQLNPSFSPAYSNLLFSLLHNDQFDTASIFSEHLQFAENYEKPLFHHTIPHTNKCSDDRKLRIGYLSPDFKRHSVAYFIEPVLKAHNKNNFEIFCYSNSPVQDDVTKRMKRYTDQWRDIVHMNDEQAAALIKNDGIDILVDLAGHTSNNRILLFARKSAPIQINWIGYPASTGLSSIDYRLVDCYTDPPGMTEQFHTEKLIRLPEIFLCYLPDCDSPEINVIPALEAGCITFGSFNKFSKISSKSFLLWTAILNKIPNSHLILKSIALSDSSTRNYALDKFAEGGIEKNRIKLYSWLPSIREHLELYNRIDIGLDTFPYNGTTTTCEAMWMGVPVITLAGKSHASRVGVSLLSNLGLPELIATTPEEYVAKAIDLARDLEKLQSLRKCLRDMMSRSPLTDAKKFTHHLEEAYRRMWINWCTKNQ